MPRAKTLEMEREMAAELRAYLVDARTEMTDDELEEGLVETVVPILRRRPKLAAMVLRAVGAGSNA